MSEITLEQVRDELRSMSMEKSGDMQFSPYECQMFADAIDAHLTRAPVQVTDEIARDVAECLQFSGWATGGDFEDDFLPDVRRAIEYARLGQPVVADIEDDGPGVKKALAAHKEYLSQPHPQAAQAAQGGEAQEEAVGEYLANVDAHGGVRWINGKPPHGTKLYTHPADRSELQKQIEANGNFSLSECPDLWPTWVHKAINEAVEKAERAAVLYGHVIVPITPTDAMCIHARERMGISSNVAYNVYMYMLDAAPMLAGKEKG